MGVKGRLSDMPLADILQIIHAEKRTVGIHLASEMGFGHLYLKQGELTHAAYKDLSGKEALIKLLTWKNGDFDVVYGESAQEDSSIDMPFDLLMKEMVSARSGVNGRVKGVDYHGDIESIKLIHTLIDTGILEKVGG